jgi:hypothetical protein
MMYSTTRNFMSFGMQMTLQGPSGNAYGILLTITSWRNDCSLCSKMAWPTKIIDTGGSQQTEVCGFLRRHPSTLARSDPRKLVLGGSHGTKADCLRAVSGTPHQTCKHSLSRTLQKKSSPRLSFSRLSSYPSQDSHSWAPFLQDKATTGAAMHPLFLWETRFWAAIHSCYMAHKAEDLGNLPKCLALCLVMLALLPATARPTQTLRLKALAREARKHLREQASPRPLPDPVYFRASPATKFPPQIDVLPQEIDAGWFSAHREHAHRGIDEVDGSPIFPAQAVRCSSPSQYTVPKEMAPATSEEELEPLTPTPFDNNGTEDPECDMRKLMWLDFGTTVETQQGGESGGPPACKGHPEKEDGRADACKIRQGRRRMREGNGGGQLDNAGGACKVARRSAHQKVCPPICLHWWW